MEKLEVDKKTEVESVEIARIHVYSAKSSISEIARDIIDQLNQGVLQAVDLSIISSGQNEIVIIGYKSSNYIAYESGQILAEHQSAKSQGTIGEA